MIDDYIEAHIDAEPPHLRRLVNHANRSLLYCRMMSGHVQGRFLKMLTQMIRPQRVLELGTFAGYSTLCMAEALDGDRRIDTVEIDDELVPFLRSHFGATPLGRHIELHTGNALDVVPALHRAGRRWDMAFVDADKRLYPQYLDMLLRLMAPGAWIIADNTLWNGKVEQALNGETARRDPQLDGIMTFNRMVAANPRLEKVMLPLRDGLTIIRIK